MEKEYTNAKEIKKMTGLGYQSSMKVINIVREKMKEKGFYIPQSRSKVALTWMIKKELGLK